MSPMVNTATEHGMTGDVIMGNVRPSASDNKGYTIGITRSTTAKLWCLPVSSRDACFTARS